MRVITGKYKSRHFDIPRSFKARPTTDFAKENIFNVLMGYIDFDESPLRCCQEAVNLWSVWKQTATIVALSASV